MAEVKVLVFSAWMVFTMMSVESFILGGVDQCPVPAPCTCSVGTISCDSKSLTTIPNIFPFSQASSRLYLNFDQNRLTTIPTDVFQNVSTANATDVFVNFFYNSISSISDAAFNGIENTVTSLDLRSNRLTTIPMAVSKLVNIEYLTLQGNPFTSIDANVLVRIQRNLHTFTFSAGQMTSWPHELRLLQWLKVLRVDFIPLTSLPYDAFHGFETSLQELKLAEAKFDRIPENICRLRNLYKLTYQATRVDDHFSFHDLCHEPLPEMTSLSLYINDLSHFPNGIFTAFPNLTFLTIDNNKLRYIPSEYIPVNNALQRLSLEYNLISGIAYVNAFPKLKALDLSHNQIYSIERNDLSGLTQLTELSLYDNPIEYIHKDAFNQTPMLETILMWDTHLKEIPYALTTLHTLRALEIRTSNGTECSCDKMARLKSWQITDITITGQCELSNEPIKDFILNTLPYCPS